MGNKPSRSKSFSEGTNANPVKKRKKSKTEKTKDPSKHISCPELGAVPYRSTSRDESSSKAPINRDVAVTIYRSYGDEGHLKSPYFKDGNEPVGFKYHRRSARFPSVERRHATPNTLPRNFGRSKSEMYPPRGALTPNGEIPVNVEVPTKDDILRSGRSSTRSSKHRSRTSSANSSSRLSAPILPTDFPTTDEIKKKLTKYEDIFVSELVAHFCELPADTQLNSVVIAIDRAQNNRYVSLHEYFQDENEDSIPIIMTAEEHDGRYVLTVPNALLHGIVHVRRDKISENSLWLAQARDLVRCVAVEAAIELSRIYEYQIALIYDDTTMRIIAKHAVECVMEHVRTNQFIDRNSVLFSVANTYPPNEDGARKFISGVVGTKELKWDLYELYKKPGLRKELTLQTDEILNDSGIDSPGVESYPWRFYYSENSEPFLYGYRGQLLEWDYAQCVYRLDMQEQEQFKKEIAMQPEDFHRLYMPYKRLVGYELMQTYCNKPTDGDTPKNKLADVLRTNSSDGTADREEIQPVYRPLSIHTNGINYDNAVLDNVDLTRANMKDADLSETRAQNAKLLLADIDMTNVENSNLDGADISYSNVQARELSPDSLKVVTARHVMLSETGDALEGDPELLNVPDLPSPKSPGGGRSPGLNTSFVSDGDGNVFTVPEAVEQQKVRAAAEEEEKKRQEEEEARRKQAEQEKRVLVVREKLKDQSDVTDGVVVKPASRKKKKKTRRGRVDEVAEFMNQSVESETAHSVTDYNILDDKPTHTVHRPIEEAPVQALNVSQTNQAYQPAPNGHAPHQNGYTNGNGYAADDEKSSYPSNTVPYRSNDEVPEFLGKPSYMGDSERHNKSMDDVLDYGSRSSPSDRYQNNNKSEELLVKNTAHMSFTPAPPDSFLNMSMPAQRYSNGNILETSLDNGYPYSGGAPRCSTVERRPRIPSNKMVKSHSLHGQMVGAGKGMSVSMDAYGLGSLSGRRMLSQAELEYLRRSQIFTMLKGLHIDNLDPMLPPLCDPFLGRKEEKFDIADLISASGRIITLTGCPGIGKSNLAIAVASELIKKYVNPVYIDCRTCRTVEGVRQKLLSTFGVYFKAEEMDYFYNWVNSHEQRMLFLFDNLELNEAFDSKLSEFIDCLLSNIKNLRILSTSVRQFFRGQAMHETYRVGDIRDYSDMIMDMLLPDLHAEGKQALVEATDHVLFGLFLSGKAFSIANVDAGKLFEDLTSKGDCGLNVNRLQDAIFNFTTNELEQDRLMKLSLIVRKAMEHLPSELVDLLVMLGKIPGDFELSTAQALSSSLDSEAVQDYMDELVTLGLVLHVNDRFILPFVVRLVLDNCWPDNGENTTRVVKHFIDKLKTWTRIFNSVDCYPAMEQIRANYTNIMCLLRWVVEHEDAYEYCREFADLDYAMFLCEVLPYSLYEDIYESLRQQAEDENDVITKTNALCCLAYKCLVEENFEDGKNYAEMAYDALHAAQIDEKDKAFCMLCLGKAYWADAEFKTKDKGLSLVRSALDIYKQYYTLKDAKAIFANEEYGRLLVEKESFQRARHIFNLSDLVMKEVLDKHPLLILSYDQRRSIWDKLFLFGRATDISQKAVDVSKLFYGDHPITADMLTRLCECIMKRGSLQDAIQACIEALQIRIKVLGDQKDTALSYKTLAYLMLRSGQYDEACRFAQCAIDIYDKIDAREKYKIDARNIMTQARHRLETRSSLYLQLDSRDASRNNVSDMHNQSCFASFSTEV